MWVNACAAPPAIMALHHTGGSPAMESNMKISALRPILAVAALALTGLAWSVETGSTAQGRPYVSGGVSNEELQDLHAAREKFSLWVITAARRSGAYLSDVQVNVKDAKRRIVFDGRLDGPWLFVDLPLGRYDIEATFEAETQKKTTTIHAGDHHQALFYFNVAAEVSPEGEKPVPANVYGIPKR
jgi:hypothetical protein